MTCIDIHVPLCKKDESKWAEVAESINNLHKAAIVLLRLLLSPTLGRKCKLASCGLLHVKSAVLVCPAAHCGHTDSCGGEATDEALITPAAGSITYIPTEYILSNQLGFNSLPCCDLLIRYAAYQELSPHIAPIIIVKWRLNMWVFNLEDKCCSCFCHNLINPRPSWTFKARWCRQNLSY